MFFYLDISFEETLRRHATKPNCHEFGEDKMRSWYRPLDLTHFPGEICIPEAKSLQESVALIMKESGLSPSI